MKRRKKTPVTRIAHALRLPSREHLLMHLRRPRATFFVVVIFLFIVVMNWAVQQAAWLPLPAELATPRPAEPAPVSVQERAVEKVEKSTTHKATPESARKEFWDYFHPTWKETTTWNQLGGMAKLPPDLWSVSEQSLRQYVDDPQRKLSPEFQVAPEMRNRVLFWMRIHTQYNSYMRVLHDRNNLSLIYGVVDFSPLFRESSTDPNAMAKTYRLERQILTELKARLSEATGLTQTNKLSAYERNEIRAMFSRAGALGYNEAASAVHSIRSQTGQRDEFLLALSRSEDLLPYIEATFRSFDLPAELARIPFVESSFNPRAYSKVGATGIFQFMPFTARQMIHPTRSELWSDPLLQTRAAARMLLIFRSMLPDWSTTVTAYNSGAGRLQRLVRKHRTKSVAYLTEVRDPTGLGFAGKNFYAQFLSANLAQAYRREIFPLRKRDEEDLILAFERPRTFARRLRTVY